jgi:hypothetical protein
MTLEKDTATSPTLAPEDANGKPKISLDWWAVIFALALAAIVYVGVQVTW